MIKISRNNQIIFYAIILIFVVFFFFYFYRQASVTENDFIEVDTGVKQPAALLNGNNAEINAQLFNSEKFRNLRADVAPIQSFQTGKRDPFMAF